MGLEEEILADVKRQGIEQGIEQNKKEFVKQLLQKEFSAKKIHEMFELPLEFILIIEKELEE